MMMWGLVLLLLLAFFIDPIHYNSAAVMELARIGCYGDSQHGAVLEPNGGAVLEAAWSHVNKH